MLAKVVAVFLILLISAISVETLNSALVAPCFLTTDLCSSPTKLLSLIAIASLLGSFTLLFFASGRLVQKSLRWSSSDSPLTLLTGALLVGVVLVALGHLEVLSKTMVSAIIVFIMVADTIVTPEWSRPKIDLSHWTRTEKGLLTIIALYLVARFFEVFMPNGQGDALYYHVAGAKLWANTGSVSFVNWHPWLVQGGLLEYIYLLPATFISPPIALLLICQGLHALFGICIAPYFALKLSELFLPRIWALLATFAFVTIPHDPMTLVRAKNDGLVLALCLAALYFGCLCLQKKSRPFLEKTILLGAGALAVKHTALFFLIPYTLWFCWQCFQKRITPIPRFTILAASVALGTSMLLRNYLWTQNPVFPAMGNLFPSPYLNTAIIEESQRYTRSTSASYLWEFIRQFKNIYIAKLIFIFAAVPALFSRKLYVNPLFSLGWMALALVILVTGAGTGSYRFYYYLLAVVAIVSVDHLEHWTRNRKRKYIVFAFVFAGGLIESGYEVPFTRLAQRTVLFYVSQKSYLTKLIQEKPIVEVFDWINKNYSSGHILSNSTQESLLLNIPVSLDKNVILASETFAAKNLTDFAERFRKNEYTLLLTDEKLKQDLVKYPYLNDLSAEFKEVYRTGRFVVYETR